MNTGDPLQKTELQEGNNPFALSIGDLMAALLLVFVLLLSATLLLIKENEEQTVDLVAQYEALQDSLYLDLLAEFRGDLEKWSAEINRQTLSIRFKEPDVLFEKGRADVRPGFAAILSDFFPRYVRILRRQEYLEAIEEIRIEGHTSTEWSEGADQETSYFNNMELSQNRTRSVLRYVLGTIEEEGVREWTRKLITANGLSSSQPILKAGTGEEDMGASRRVEFRVRTDAERQLREILDQLAGSTSAKAVEAAYPE